MRAQLLSSLALLTPPTLANPLYRYYFHHPRQASSSTISLTSTGTLTAQTNDITRAAERCIATHVASPSTTCQDVATQYGIQLSTSDTQSLASSDDCKLALQGYRLCIRTDDNNTSVPFPALPATALQGPFNSSTTSTSLAVETSSTTSSATSPITLAATPSSTDVTSALAAEMRTTRLTTFTFTQGLGASASVRELVLTRVETESASSTSSTESTAAASTETTSSESTIAALTTTGTTTATTADAAATAAGNVVSSSVTSAAATESASSTSSDSGPVTMFSVSADVITQSTTMTNSYVEGDVTHVNEVVVMHVTTDFSTIFSTVPASANLNAASTEAPSSPPTTASPSEMASSAEPTSSPALETSALATTSAPASTTTDVAPLPPTNKTVAAASAIAADCTTLSAPAPTQSGIAAGCAKWHTVAVGETCDRVAAQNGITTDALYEWNSAIDSTCSNLWAGNAYCVGGCGPPAQASNLASNVTLATNATSAATSASASTLSPTLTPGATNLTATDVYQLYTGDGSAAAGWPSMAKWVDFDTMFTQNTPNMKASCAQWNVQENTDEEQHFLRSAILSQSQTTGIDPRFILAIVLQESTGCVRVITTAYSVPNPGLMQSHNGTGTCNPMNTHPGLAGATTHAIKVTDPCPETEIDQMIKEGVGGTESGDGLEQVLIKQASTDDVAKWYRAARMYNGGSIAPNGDLGQGCCTACYASDVANRLTGWVNAPSSCTLTLTPTAR